MNDYISLNDTIDMSFTQYAGAVIQSRALVDVRDCVKPSARQIYYCLYTDNFTNDKPFKKTLKAIGSAMRLYIHGDSSCAGIIMRSSQPFCMRYPLIEVEGSYGTLMEPGNWGAPRYTASRLSKIANYLIQDTTKEVINEWEDNYDDTEQYPRVLSSLGFYNIVNGTMGIGVGIASSIPSFNLKEVNDALITLLKNPNCDFEDILCYPDFATGGTIVNKDDIKESLAKGSGTGCIIQATMDYDSKQKVITVKDLPYGVYTNKICNDIVKLVKNVDNSHIININDLTGEDVCIKIYLDKTANFEEVKQLLYGKTSLQDTYGINMTMLQDGKYPKVFGWREALLAHLEHEKICYINMYNTMRDKFEHRLKIVNAILIAIDNIEKVIKIIKSAESVAVASKELMNYLEIDKEQAKAILDIKLSRLAHLEADKFIKEKNDLENRVKDIEETLSSEERLKEKMIERFKEVSEKFGDKRRTKVVQKEIKKITTTAQKKKAAPEPVVIVRTEKGYIKSIPTKMFKTTKDNILIGKCDTNTMIYLISNMGKLYKINSKKIKQCGTSDKGTALGSILPFVNGEKIIYGLIETEEDTHLIFASKNGQVKKIKCSEIYGSTQNLRGVKVMGLKDDNVIIAAFQEKDEKYIKLNTKLGYQIVFNSNEVSFSGKAAGGVKGINLNAGDEVVLAEITAAKASAQKRGGKGKKIK